MPVKRANKSGKIYGGEDRTPLIAPFTRLLFLPSNEMFLPIRQIIPSNRKVEDGKILDGCVIIVGGEGRRTRTADIDRVFRSVSFRDGIVERILERKESPTRSINYAKSNYIPRGKLLLYIS